MGAGKDGRRKTEDGKPTDLFSCCFLAFSVVLCGFLLRDPVEGGIEDGILRRTRRTPSGTLRQASPAAECPARGCRCRRSLAAARPVGRALRSWSACPT